MAFCPECGHPLVEGAGFCSNCGSPVPGAGPTQSVAPQQPAPAPYQQPVASQQPTPMPYQQPAPYQQTAPYQQPPQQVGAQGYLQAGPSMGNVTAQRARSINIAAILCVVVGLAAMGVIFFTLNQRLGETGFSFGGANDTPTQQEQESVTAPQEGGKLDPVELNTDVDGDAAGKRTSTYGASAPAGNLLNGGYVASDGEWVYYAIPAQGSDWTTNAIGRMKPDGSSKSVIYRASKSGVYIWHMVAEGGRLFFVEESESGNAGGQLVSIETNGSGRKVHPSPAPASSVMLNEGVVYVGVEDGIYAYDVEADKATYITGGPGGDDLWRTYGTGSGARLFYFTKGGSNVYAAQLGNKHLSGTKVVGLTGKAKVINAVPAEGKLWLLVDNDGNGYGDAVFEAALDGSTVGQYAKASGTAYRINVCEKGVILVVGDSKSERIELITKKDAKPTVYYSAPADTDLRLPAVVGDYLYFGDYGSNHLYRIPLDSPGKTPETVA